MGLNILGYLCVIVVLWSYALSPWLFNWGNAVTFIPLMAIAVYHHAYPNALISLAFGIIAIYKIVRGL